MALAVCLYVCTESLPVVDFCCFMQLDDNNNNNNPICKAPECQKTSEALADRNSRAN